MPPGAFDVMRLTNDLLPKPGFEPHVPVEGICPVCHYCSEAADALKRLIASRGGVVSFEYVLVAAAVVGAVVLTFGTAGGAGPIKDALATGLTKVTAAVGG